MYSTIITVSIIIIVLIILIASLFLLTKKFKFYGGITKKSDRRVVVTDIIPLWDSYGPDEKCFITLVYEQISDVVNYYHKSGEENDKIIESIKPSYDNTIYANSYELIFAKDAFDDSFCSIMTKHSNDITNEVIEKCESEESRFDVADKKQAIALTVFQKVLREYLSKTVDGQPIFKILTDEQKIHVDSKIAELGEVSNRKEYIEQLNQLTTDIVKTIEHNYGIINGELKSSVKPSEMCFNKKAFMLLFKNKDYKNKFIFDFMCWKYLQLPKFEQM